MPGPHAPMPLAAALLYLRIMKRPDLWPGLDWLDGLSWWPKFCRKGYKIIQVALGGGEAIILSYSMKYNYKCFKNKPQKIDGFIQAGDGFSGETKSIYKKC